MIADRSLGMTVHIWNDAGTLQQGGVELDAAVRNRIDRSKAEQKQISIGLMAGLPIDLNERFEFI